MMRGGWRAGLFVLGAALVWHCSGEPDAAPPPPPDAGATTSVNVSTFAMDAVLLGDTDDAGTPSAGGWRTLGYDLDGKNTNKASTDVCTLDVAAPAVDQMDGIGGRDNAFGLSIVPIIETVSGPLCGGFLGPCDAGPLPPPLSVAESEAIQGGAFTLQIVTVGLSDDSRQDATGLEAEVFDSDAFDGPSPAFDSTTDWPVLPESLTNGADIPSGALARFTSAYVSHGTFVAGVNEHVTIPLHAVINGFKFTLPIHEAIVTFDHVGPDEAANGVLAGVLDVKELTAIFQRQAGGVSQSLCGSAFDGIAEQIAQTADILADRTNHAGTPCTAISFGMGFHAKRIANPTKVAPPLDLWDPCADAGPDADAALAADAAADAD